MCIKCQQYEDIYCSPAKDAVDIYELGKNSMQMPIWLFLQVNTRLRIPAHTLLSEIGNIFFFLNIPKVEKKNVQCIMTVGSIVTYDEVSMLSKQCNQIVIYYEKQACYSKDKYVIICYILAKMSECQMYPPPF